MSTLGTMEQNTASDGNSSADDQQLKTRGGRVTDREMVAAARLDPESILDLLSRGGNAGARDPDSGRTPLHWLVGNGGSKDVVDAVLKRMTGEEINALDNEKYTALSLAVMRSKVETVRILLDNGASPNVKGESVYPLNRACDDGDEEIASLLIKKGADTKALDDSSGLAAIWRAVRRGSKPLISLLLNNGVDVNDPADSEGWTPLIVACYWEQEDIVEFLVSEQGAQVNKAQFNKSKDDRDNEDNEKKLDRVTPLQLACRWNLLRSVKLLMSKSADAKAVDSQGRTALYRAAGHATAELIDYLLERNVDIINKFNEKGRTPLAKAIRRGNYPAVESLIKKGADINFPDKEGQTPLIVALCEDQRDAVEKLLAQESSIDVKAPGKNGWTPLMVASIVGPNREAVRRILDLKAPVDDVDCSGCTALHRASYLGHENIVGILLDVGRSDPRKAARNGQTALHKAAKRGFVGIVGKILGKMLIGGGVDIQDNCGWTALHYASFCQIESVSTEDAVREELGNMEFITDVVDVNSRGAGHYKVVMRLLLALRAKVKVRTNSSETPLHLAAMHSVYHEERIKVLLEDMQEEDIPLADIFTDEDILEIIGKSSKPSGPHQIVVWAAEKRETQLFVPLLVKGSKRAAITGDLCKDVFPQATWSALNWAAYTGDKKLAWQLLRSLERTPENDSDIQTALKVAEDVKRSLELAGERLKWDRDPGSKRRKDGVTGEDSTARIVIEEEFQTTIDLLGDPPFVPTSITPSEPYEKAEPRKIMERFNATIVNFYAKGSQTGFLRRNRTVKEVLCDKDPGTIMKEARDRLKRLDRDEDKEVLGEKDPGRIMKDAKDMGKGLDGAADKVFADEDFKFRWIHLPANNMQWMNELITIIGLGEKRSEEDFRSLKSFFKNSWQEIPHGSSKSRLMKPTYLAKETAWQCSKRDRSGNPSLESTGKEKERPREQPSDLGLESTKPGTSEAAEEITKNDPETPAELMTAVYIPYIRFGKTDIEKDNDANYRDLLEEYKEQVHAARTLDEFYYHTAGDEELEKDLVRRNRDQVVSREIHGDDLKKDLVVGKDHNGDDRKEPKLKSWKILRIDEVWIWVINKETIITASTYCPDQVQNLATVILKELGKETETSKNGPQPDSAHRMSEFIVDSCVKFYITRRDDEVKVDGIEPKNLSTHQIFSDSINKMAIKEAELFEVFTKDNTESQKEGQITNEHRTTQIGKTASLLCKIKDIRDELRIIGTLARYQRDVQKQLLREKGDTQPSAQFVIQEIGEMEKIAKSLQEAVSTTLTLQQSETAISQSTEAVQQGRTLMVFTITTILFLPMSFFTSLFAVNITLFQHDPNGQLLYQPKWIFPIIFGISIPIFIACLVYAYWANIPLSKWLRRKKTKTPDGAGGAAAYTGENTRKVLVLGTPGGYAMHGSGSVWKRIGEGVAESLQRLKHKRQKEGDGLV